MLRKLLTPVVLFTVLTLVSCDDKKEEPKIEHPLIGTWVLQSYTVSGCNEPEFNRTEEKSCPGETCEKIEFKSNGTVIYYQWDDGVFEGEGAKFTIDGNTFLACESTDDCDDVQTFIITGTTLTFSHTSADTGCTTTQVAVKE